MLKKGMFAGWLRAPFLFSAGCLAGCLRAKKRHNSKKMRAKKTTDSGSKTTKCHLTLCSAQAHLGPEVPFQSLIEKNVPDSLFAVKFKPQQYPGKTKTCCDQCEAYGTYVCHLEYNAVYIHCSSCIRH